MLIGLIMLMAAQVQPAAAPSSADATYGPTLPAKSKPRPAAKPASDPCKSTRPEDVKDDTQEIVVCAQRVEGYRIDPDVLEAQRVKQHKQPRGRDLLVDNSCASVGPMGCRGGAGINLIAAAVTAATMVKKAVNGENVGEMFVTDPQPDEYQLYLQAKREREAREAESAAAAKAKSVEPEASSAATSK